MLEYSLQEEQPSRGSGDQGRSAPARLLPLMNRLIAAQNEAGDNSLLRKLCPIAWTALAGFPEEVLNMVRNRRLYRKYLCGAVSELLSLLDMAWAQHPPAIEVQLYQTAET